MTTVNSTTNIVLQSLNNIEREIQDLRRLIGEKPEARRSLRGILRGMVVSEEEIAAVRKEWEKELDEFGDNDN